MTRKEYEVDEIFGITRGLPMNYVVREEVDDKLQKDLSRGQHIVIYGSSKQGKTCLRKKCIEEKEQITIQCSNNWSLSDIHSAILKRAGMRLHYQKRRLFLERRRFEPELERL